MLRLGKRVALASAKKVSKCDRGSMHPLPEPADFLNKNSESMFADRGRTYE